MKKVLITSRSFGKMSDEPMRILEEAGFETIRMGTDFDMEKFETILPDCDALIIGAHPLRPELLDRCKKLKIVCKHGVGLDNLPLEKLKACGIAATNTPGTNSEAVADLAFALMLDVSRNVTLSERHLKEGLHKQDVGLDVYGKTLGLLGFGKIGQAVARRARGFSMRVLAYDPYLKETTEGLGFVKIVDREQIFTDSDFVSVHLPLTPETQGSVGREELSRMKKEACLINTARGGIVDEKVLYELLANGGLRAAGLDVTEKEPTEADDPLLTLDNVVVTNHIGMYSREAITAVSLLCAQAVADIFAGREPKHRVA